MTRKPVTGAYRTADSHSLVTVEHSVLLIGYSMLGWAGLGGLGWVIFAHVSQGLGWVGSINSWVGLGWVTENGPMAVSGQL